ncbi:GPI-anchored surface protein, putative [Bodo saltans]|uniref:GPI-anchored surface protein, putative n=1 Tax=Bodo saltans TaxID=75058 RepID=A0A0S4INB6_BODSA|nr:GPI-anchored surface protein, putative [Bodo saltans]|eukprot:CUF64712.1 GPI-anchored surface protein, putative [Bodo saltans]
MSSKAASLTVEQREAKRREIEEKVKAMLSNMDSPKAVAASHVVETTQASSSIENKPQAEKLSEHKPSKDELVEAKKSMLRERVKSSRSAASELLETTQVPSSNHSEAEPAKVTLIPEAAVVVEAKKTIAPVKVHPSALPSNDSAAVAQLRAKLHAAKSDSERLALAQEITTKRYPLSQSAQKELKAKFDSEAASLKAKEAEAAEAKAKKEAEAAEAKAKKEAEEKAAAAAVEAFPDVSLHDVKVHGVLGKKKASMKETVEEAEARRKRTAEERAQAEEEARVFREKKAADEAAALKAEAKKSANASSSVPQKVEAGQTSEAIAAAARIERDARRKEEEEAEREALRKVLEEQRAAKRASFQKVVEAQTKASPTGAADKKAATPTAANPTMSTQDVFTELKEQTDATYAKLEAEALAKISIDAAASQRERERAAKARQERDERNATLLASKLKRSSSNAKSTFVEKKSTAVKGSGKVVPKEASTTDASLSKTVTPGMWVLAVALAFFIIAALAR